MSRNNNPELKQLFRDLKRIPLLEKCRTGMAATSLFYEGLRVLREGREVVSGSDVGDLGRIAWELERTTLAYAPRGNDGRLKVAALYYSDSLFPRDLGHLATPYAHAEIRIRRLEILCLNANLKYGVEWSLLSNQREAELVTAVRSWQRLFETSVMV